MKKIFPYILMFLIFANLFAPLSVEVGKNNTPQINAKIAEAGSGTFVINISPSNGEYAYITGTYEFTGTPNQTKSRLYGGTIEDNLGVLPFTNILPEQVAPISGTPNRYSYSFKYKYTGLTPGKTYYIQVEVYSATNVIEKSAVQSFASGGVGVIQNNIVTVSLADAKKAYEDCMAQSSMQEIQDGKCKAAKDAYIKAQEAYKAANKKTGILDIMPECGIANSWLTSGGTIYGCAAQIIYYVLFVPTSYIFALTGQFFDWSFGYSVNDNSYRSPFVLQGWGLVRDFCNIFFIFVLLYVAFSTILSIHGFKTKEMIINVVIIGLLINFSLFASQVIIDASNILARVFYNSNAIKITEKGANCTTADGQMCLDLGQVSKVGDRGEIPLSAALVNKINPQNLIINGSKAVVLEDTVSGDSGTADEGGAIGAGAFILITLLAIGVNVVGLIVFLSVGLIFIARVIGLWLAMIFVPLAFFSYTVPPMQDMKMVGWRHWWPETLKLAFLAPIFIFFLYLILQFLDTGLGLIDAGNKTGASFVIATTVPFIFIMVLLWQAKGIAKDLSGTIGQSITGAVATVGGLALGGAALGGAALLRSTVGATARYVQNDGARKKDSFANYGNWSVGKKLNPLSYVKATAAGAAKQTFKITVGKDALGNKVSLGKKMQEADKGFGEKTHATQILDDKMKSEFGHQYGKDAKFTDLTEPEQKIVKQEVDKDEMAKKEYGKKFKDLEAPEAKIIKNRYDAGERAIADEHGKTIRVADASTVNATAGEKIKSDSIVDFSKINASTGEFVQALRKGSMDIRNASQAKATSKGFPKMAVGFLAAVAAGTRMGMKESGINHGTGQGDVMKDLKNTITESLKSLKVKVDVGHSGGDDHGKEAKSVGH